MKKKYKLDTEEEEILKSFDDGEWISVLTPKRKAVLLEVAKNTTKKTKRVNIRMSERDFERINIKAIERETLQELKIPVFDFVGIRVPSVTSIRGLLIFLSIEAIC